VVGTAKNGNSVIAGMAIAGFGGANCQMAAFSLSELLPNKWRHIGVVLADASTVIAVTVAPVSARFGIETNTWRWNFYAAAIFQFLSFLGLLFMYFPPAHPLGLPFKTVIKELDYLGKLSYSGKWIRY
jgi:MFS family permease